MKLVLLPLALSFVLALAGCSSDTRRGIDSGSPDSGGGTDSGGTDTGTTTDSGSTTDSGTTTDSSTTTDSGSAGDGGDTGTLPPGACTNTADEAVIAGADFEAQTETCARDCFAGRMCVIDCMRDDVGLSMGCSVCFGEAGQCALDNCLSECLTDPRGAACTDCRRAAGCIDAYESCSGLTGA